MMTTQEKPHEATREQQKKRFVGPVGVILSTTAGFALLGASLGIPGTILGALVGLGVGYSVEYGLK